MSANLTAILRLVYNSTLDFASGYTIAKVNDAFFSSDWHRFFGYVEVENKDRTVEENIFSLIMRIWGQVIMTAIVGSEVRALLFPTEALDGFHLLLFTIGISRQEVLWHRLAELQKLVIAKINGYSGFSMPHNKPTDAPTS